MSSPARADTQRLIARQIALTHGHVWDRLPISKRQTFLTIANTILATVERKMENVAGITFKRDMQQCGWFE